MRLSLAGFRPWRLCGGNISYIFFTSSGSTLPRQQKVPNRRLLRGSRLLAASRLRRAWSDAGSAPRVAKMAMSASCKSGRTQRVAASAVPRSTQKPRKTGRCLCQSEGRSVTLQQGVPSGRAAAMARATFSVLPVRDEYSTMGVIVGSSLRYTTFSGCGRSPSLDFLIHQDRFAAARNIQDVAVDLVDAAHELRRDDCLGRPFAVFAAVPDDDAVADFKGLPQVVQDQDDACAETAVQVFDELQYFKLVRNVEEGRRFVQKEQVRFLGDDGLQIDVRAHARLNLFRLLLQTFRPLQDLRVRHGGLGNAQFVQCQDRAVRQGDDPFRPLRQRDAARNPLFRQGRRVGQHNRGLLGRLRLPRTAAPGQGQQGRAQAQQPDNPFHGATPFRNDVLGLLPFRQSEPVFQARAPGAAVDGIIVVLAEGLVEEVVDAGVNVELPVDVLAQDEVRRAPGVVLVFPVLEPVVQGRIERGRPGGLPGIRPGQGRRGGVAGMPFELLVRRFVAGVQVGVVGVQIPVLAEAVGKFGFDAVHGGLVDIVVQIPHGAAEPSDEPGVDEVVDLVVEVGQFAGGLPPFRLDADIEIARFFGLQVFIAPDLYLHAAHVAVHVGIEFEHGRRAVPVAVVGLDAGVPAQFIGQAGTGREFGAEAAVVVPPDAGDEEEFGRDLPLVLQVAGIGREIRGRVVLGHAQVAFLADLFRAVGQPRAGHLLVSVFQAVRKGVVRVRAVGVLPFDDECPVFDVVKVLPGLGDAFAGFLAQPVVVGLELVIVFGVPAEILQITIGPVVIEPFRHIVAGGGTAGRRVPRRVFPGLFLEEGRAESQAAVFREMPGAVHIEVAFGAEHVRVAVRIGFAHVGQVVVDIHVQLADPSRGQAAVHGLLP